MTQGGVGALSSSLAMGVATGANSTVLDPNVTSGGGTSAVGGGLYSQYMILGLGLNQTLIKTRQGYKELNLASEEANYHRAINRLIIIN